jgi:hypothetical protein
MRIRFDRKIQGGCNLKKNHNKISYNWMNVNQILKIK